MKLELVSVVVAFVAQKAASESWTASKWKYCDYYTTDNPNKGQAECAKFSAPLCYPGVCTAPTNVDETIELFVKKYAAEYPITATNVWIVGGDTGVASDQLEVTMAALSYALNTSVNIYTMDPRGSGRSTRLDCAVAAKTLPYAFSMDPSLVASCAEELELKYGDLAAFSTTSAAHDLVNLIDKLSNDANTILYGVQYGALLVERVMHLKPHGVTGYVLDSPLSTMRAGHYLTDQDREIGEVANAFMKRCDHDRVCSSHFKEPNTLTTVYQDILADYDNHVNSSCLEGLGDCDIFGRNVSASIAIRGIVSFLLAHVTLQTKIPQLIYRLQGCRYHNLEVVVPFLGMLRYVAEVEHGSLYSSVLSHLITFSELWERPAPSLAELKRRSTDSVAGMGVHLDLPLYCAFSKEQSKACAKYDFGQYESQGIIYKPDKYWNKRASIPRQASVLVLSSTMDVSAPHKYTQRLVESLDGDNKELVAFKYGAHGTVTSTLTHLRGDVLDPCALKVLASYVNSDGDLGRLDKSCLDEMPALEMIPSDFRKADLVVTII